jgi:hypothetical protein
MVSPDSNGTPLLPERSAPKGLLPSTWLERGLRIQYVSASGKAVEAKGTLLDFYSAGPVLSMNGGTKTLVSWDRICLCELIED